MDTIVSYFLSLLHFLDLVSLLVFLIIFNVLLDIFFFIADS